MLLGDIRDVLIVLKMRDEIAPHRGDAVDFLGVHDKGSMALIKRRIQRLFDVFQRFVSLILLIPRVDHAFSVQPFDKINVFIRDGIAGMFILDGQHVSLSPLVVFLCPRNRLARSSARYGSACLTGSSRSGGNPA